MAKKFNPTPASKGEQQSRGVASFSPSSVESFNPDTAKVSEQLKEEIKTTVNNYQTKKQGDFWNNLWNSGINLDPVWDDDKPVKSFVRKVSATKTKFLANTVLSAGRMLSGVGFMLSEPWEAPNLIPEKINIIRWAHIIDELNPTNHSALRNYGYSRPDSYLESAMKRADLTIQNLRGKISNTDYKDAIEKVKQDRVAGLEKLESEMLAKDTYTDDEGNEKSIYKGKKLMPLLRTTLTPLQVASEKYGWQDGKPSWFLSKLVDSFDQEIAQAQETIGAFDTGSAAADYILGGTAGLIGSVGGSVATGGMLAKGFGQLAKVKGIAARPMATEMAKKLSVVGISASQTGGESYQVAKDAMNLYMSERAAQLGGFEYNQSLQNALVTAKTQAIEKGVSDAQIERLLYDVQAAHLNEWLDNTPEGDEIRKNGLKAYQTAMAVNGWNLALNMFSSGLYMKGKFPSRNVVDKPAKGAKNLISKQNLYGGLNEYAEENVNFIAEKVGRAEADGRMYLSLPDDVLSLEGFEQGAWGFLGGWGEASIAGMMSYKARQREYLMQQKEIARQNKIGSANMQTVHDIVALDGSYQALTELQKQMEVAQDKGDKATMDAIANKMLTVQAQQAFSTGTTENLIDNYQQIANNKEMATDVRNLAKDAITKIKSYEKIYNNSLRYNNSEAVYATDSSEQLLKEAVEDGKRKAIELQNQILEEEQTQKELGEGNVPDVDVNYLQGLRNKHTQHSNNLIAIEKTLRQVRDDSAKLKSPKYQTSAKNMDLFYERMEKIKTQTERDFNKKKENRNKPFNPYESNEYLNKFNSELEASKRFLTDEDFNAIKELQKEKLESYKAQSKFFEQVAAKQGRRLQDEISKNILNMVKSDEVTPQEQQVIDDLTEFGDVIQDSFLDDFSADPIKAENTNFNMEASKAAVEKLYEYMQKKGINPTFENAVRTYGQLLNSMEKAEHALEYLARGWELNLYDGYAEIDTKKLFNDMFRDVQGLAAQLDFIVESQRATMTKEEIKEQENQTKEEEIVNAEFDNSNNVDTDMNGAEYKKSTNTERMDDDAPTIGGRKTTIKITNKSKKLDGEHATLAHKSRQVIQLFTLQESGNTVEHQKLSDELNKGEYAPEQIKLLFTDHYSAGTTLSVDIAPDFMGRLVSIYQEDGTPVLSKEIDPKTGKYKKLAMPFGQWMAQNNIKEGSPEYWDKVPMVIKDSDGHAVALVQDIQRISEYNNTDTSIESQRKYTREIRNAVAKNGKSVVRVTGKTAGSLFYPESDKKLKDVDPTSFLSVNMNSGTGDSGLKYDKKAMNIIDEELQIGNLGHARKKENKGFLYELRKSGQVEINGKMYPKYYALRANTPDTLSPDVQQSLYDVIETYLNRKTNQSVYSEFAKKLFNITNGRIDMRQGQSEILGLDKYLRQFVYLAPTSHKGNFAEQIKDTITTLADAKKAGSKPNWVMFTAGGRLVISKIYPKDAERSMSYPTERKSDAEKNMLIGGSKEGNEEILQLIKYEVIPDLKVNADVGSLFESHPVVILKNGQWQQTHKNYRDYLRDTFTTRNPAIKIKGNFNGQQKEEYVSFLQPTISIVLDAENSVTDTEHVDSTQAGSLSQDVANKLAQKIAANETLTPDEEQLRKIDPEKVQGLVEGINKLNEEQQIQKRLDDEIRKLGYLDDYFTSSDPRKMEDDERDNLIKSQRTIEGLMQSDQRAIVEYIFNSVSRFAQVKQGKLVNQSEVRKQINKEFQDYMKREKSDAQASLKYFNNLYTSNPEKYPKLTEVIKRLEKRIELVGIVDNHYEVFEDEAFIMAKKFFEIGVNNKSEDPDGDSESQENTVDVEDTKTKDYSKTAEEINHKDRVSAELRVFTQGIQAREPSVYNQDGTIKQMGQPITGIFGIPMYVGFDTVFDTVSQILADTPSDTQKVKQKLQEHSKTHNWMPDLITKLFPDTNANVSLQNQFVRYMTKHALDMEFVMFKREKNGSYKLKVFSTNSGAIKQNLVSRWTRNAKTTSLMYVKDGNYMFSLKGINDALRQYEELKNTDKTITVTTTTGQFVLNLINNRAAEARKNGKGLTSAKIIEDLVNFGGIETFKLSGQEAQGLKNLLVGKDEGTRLIMNHKGVSLELSVTGTELEVKNYEQAKPDRERVVSFLNNFGIEISDNTADEILNYGFRYDKNHLVNFSDQWLGEDTGKGVSLFGTLAGTLKQIKREIQPVEGQPLKDVMYDESGDNGRQLLNQTIIKALANIEAKHTEHRIVQSFYDNKKVLYGYTVTKYITDRMNALKNDDELIDNLLSTSYNKHSFILDLMNHDPHFRSTLEMKHLGLTALKEEGKKLYRNNALQKLSLIDHELTKLGMFMNMRQGDVTLETVSGKEKYKGLSFRIARMFSPTMSDKSTATIMKTGVVDITEATMQNMENLMNFAYEQLVMPDLHRMINKSGSTKIKNYDKGSKLFYSIPQLNDIVLDNKGTTLGALASSYGEVSGFENYKDENGVSVKQRIIDTVQKVIEAEQQKKLVQWQQAGFIESGVDGKYSNFKFLDTNYMNKRALSGTIDERIKVAAFDYVFNSMVSNANAMMLFAGDPALYYSGKDTDTSMQQVKDTFMNVGKRLANQIAPGDKIADSDTSNNKYLQLVINDVFSASENIKMIVKMNEGVELSDNELSDIVNAYRTKDDFAINGIKKKYPKSHPFFNIESTDSQEVTTWREHLYVLEKMGKSPNVMLNVTSQEIDEARQIFTENKPWKDLTERQKLLVSRVVQPMKPVYTGQIKDGDVMRTIYVKTSSFPLIPQLTAGMEIDRLRESMEKLEKEKGRNVRAVYQSGFKVGSTTTALNITNQDGSHAGIEQLTSDQLMENSIELPRSGFRIQQNVPYKSGTTEEDLITHGTQPAKLLFGNGVMMMSGFKHEGTELSGIDLQNEYFKNFQQLVSDERIRLYNQLGIDPLTHTVHENKREKFFRQISDILKREAISRGFSKQDLEALAINPETADFEMPVWMSPNSQKYEALLTAIITHRIAKIKFPGYSYVAGSEVGFQFKTDEQFDVDKNGSRVVFTDAWTGKLKSHQVLVQSKLRIDGKLVDLIQDGYAKKVDGKWMLDSSKVDPELLSSPSFRIPTSKHASIEKIEIAGFLPHGSGDLMIVSKDGIVAMGEDYDVDKRYTYHLWTALTENGIVPVEKQKIYQKAGKTPLEAVTELIRIQEKTISETLDKIKDTNRKERMSELFDMIVEKEALGEDITDERNQLNQLIKDIQSASNINLSEEKEKLRNYKAALRTFREDKKKIIQNNIIKIYNTVLSHSEVQKLMVEPLSMAEAHADAAYMEALNHVEDENFTPMSDMYHQGKVLSGAVGSDGTAAYSLDVVGHSLFEQVYAATSGERPLMLMDTDIEGQPIRLRLTFGDIISDGVLGHSRTLTPKGRTGRRSIAEVISERQNLMVDNEKEQIAIRVNLNSYTMQVDKVLNMLGFDKGNNGHSVSFMFLSQPIIKDYIQMMEARNSNTAEYDPKREQKVMEQLHKKYAPDSEVQDVNWDDQMNNVKRNDEDITSFEDEILNGGANGGFQIAVLEKFLKLKGYGENLTSIQTAMNVDSKGVGTNLFEVSEKINKIAEFYIKKQESPKDAMKKKDMAFIQNTTELIGDFVFAETTEQRIELQSKGYLNIRTEAVSGKIGRRYLMVRPKTVTGIYAVNALVSADKLWGHFFPYNFPHVTEVMKECLDVIGNSDMSEAKTIEVKTMVFNEMKKYLVTDNSLGYFTDNPQQERKRLFFDSVKGKGNKKSLATFLKDIMDSKDSKFKKIHTNRLLRRFEFDINNNGKPSLIKLDNAIGQNFDEKYIYESFIELIDLNIPLGEFDGNKNYTSLNLAQDLALYAYMEGGVQQAIQFTKYIPVSYLKVMNIQGIMRNVLESSKRQNFQQRNTLGVNSRGSNEVSRFTHQFISHHPKQAFRITEEIMNNPKQFQVIEGNKKILNSIMKFKSTVVKESQNNISSPKYVSFYNEALASENKFQLYKLAKDNETDEMMYIRIPVYGQFGMSEYSSSDDMYASLVNSPSMVYPGYENIVETNENQTVESEGNFGVEDGNLIETMTQIAALDTPVGKMAKLMLPMLSENTTMSIDSISRNGIYNRKTDAITINQALLNGDSNQLATVILREAVHSISDKVIDKYVVKGLDGLTPLEFATGTPENIEKSIRKLFVLFKETVNHFKGTGEYQGMTAKNLDTDALTDREYNVVYGSRNIFEFVERMLTSPEFQQEMNKIPFRATNESILDRFWNWLQEIFDSIGLTDANPDNITANTFESVFSMLKAEQRIEPKQDSNADVRSLLNEFGGEANMDADVVQDGDIDETGGMFDNDGNLIDENFGFDPLYAKHAEHLKAVRASLIENGILKSKCI